MPFIHAGLFSGAYEDWGTEVTLQQGWNAQPELGFQSTRVRFKANNNALLVWAELSDLDTFNPETGFNQPAFRHGDIFEMFFRPTNQSAYLEVHVGPANQIFQLRIPSAEVFEAARTQADPWKAWLIPHPCFESRAWIESEKHRWQVQARIPFTAIAEQPVKPGDRWLYSFSRYDYTRGQPKPVLSSSSPHPVPSFHRQQDWGTLVIP